jgi:hypothetical protein
MLGALAKARRAQFGDDPKMPNPMRSRLHEEIARTGTSDEEKVEESRASWITMFWPRLTVAAALATLIVLIPAIWWNQSHPLAERSEVAVGDHSAAASDQLNPAVPSENTLAKATEQGVNLADNSQIKIEPAAGPSSDSEASKSSTHVAQGPAASEFPDQPAKDFADKKIAAAKIQAAPAGAPAAGADLKAKSDRMGAAAPPVAQPSSADNLATTQQFSQQSALQSFRNNAQVNRAANVLNTFQVQQQGDEIRVLDADGSTYTGKIEQSTKSAELDSRVTARRDAARQTRAYAAKASRENESAAAQSYFRATGYNVSLKKTLVFEGNYAVPAVQQPAMATSNDRQQAESSRERARIVGTARVNGEASVEVDAIEETPEPAATKKSEK